MIALVNAKFGREPSRSSSIARDATYALDGLLNHPTDTQIEEHKLLPGSRIEIELQPPLSFKRFDLTTDQSLQKLS